MELENDMSVEDFKKYCNEKDVNITAKWNYESFKMICQKCKSQNVKVVDDLEFHEGSGCPTCGFDAYTTGKIIIKCLDCGNGMQVLSSEDLSC